jgi:hypothetical protein
LQEQWSGEAAVRNDIARNHNCPPELLEQLADTAAYDVSLNPACPPDLLARLAQGHNHWAVRRHVAGNPSTPPDVLGCLAGDPDPEVRQQALENPRLPEEYRVLRRVAQ